MKASKNIPTELLDNENSPAFQNEFFNQFKLRYADEPIKLNESEQRNYKFPTFYGEVNCSIGIFLCSYKKAEELLAAQLNTKVKPVKATKGRAIVAFSCYEYKNVMGVPPYNEIAVAIPIMVNTKFNPPLLPMLIDSFEHFGYYIAAMPVTSFENQLRGNNIWGLPKTTNDIEIVSNGDYSVTQVYEADSSELSISLKLPKTGKATNMNVKSNLYSKLNGNILQSETNFSSVFNIEKNMNLLLQKNKKSDFEYLKLGKGKVAEMLRELEIEDIPFQTRYTKGMSSCFDLPNTNIPHWLAELNK